MARQLAFDLPVVAARGRGDFFVSPANRIALASIEAWRAWPGGKLILTGPEGSGKSHLAQVWAGLAEAELVRASDLARRDIRMLAGQNLCVEDADRIAGSPRAEQALFHLHNLALAEGHSLLITARMPPSRWRLALPDLDSRMQATPVAGLEPPDDALLAAVLVKLFDDRQLAVKPPLIAFLVARMDRSLAGARALVERIDRAALAENRALTRALAARVLDNPSETGA
jgi:chromosomal replication initiation ATPase DnaA